MGASGRGGSSELRAAVAGAALVVALAVVDAVTQPGFALAPLLVLGPLLAALGARAAQVAVVAALAVAAALLLGISDETVGSTRYVVDAIVVLGGGALAVAIARLRAAEATALERIGLLDRSAQLIAAPMDHRRRLQELAQLPVPDLADLCIVDLVDDDGRLRDAVVSAAHPEDAEAVRETRRHFPIDPDGEHPVAVVMRTGEPQLRPAMTDEDLERYSASPQHFALMRRLQYSSAVVVALHRAGHIVGVLSVLRLGPGRPFGEADVALMTDLAARAAIAVDNAKLFEELRAAETQLEAILGSLAEAVTVQADDGALVYANAAAAQLLGHDSVEALLSADPADIVGEYVLLDEDGQPFDVDQLPGRRALRGEAVEPVTIVHRHRATGHERWTLVKSTAIPHPETGRPSLAVNVMEDVTEERRLRQAATFLAEASKLLASSLEFEETLERVAQAAVPEIADWCAVDVRDEGGEIRTVAVAHIDPAKVSFAREMRERYPVHPDAPTGVPRVIRAGVSELYEEIDAALLEAAARDEEHLALIREVQMSSALVVPMTAGDETLGAITFVATGGRRLTEDDRALGEELGRRAGVAVQNALVHRERTHVATTLQRSLLPPRLPVVPRLSIAARFRAAGATNQVGGDFYDLFSVDGGWMVAIGDVTGKGPAAAAITSLARYTIRTAAMYEPAPEAILDRLNQALLRAEHDQLCTAICARILGTDGDGPLRAELACAGHPPPYLVRSGSVSPVCWPGPLLGAFADARAHHEVVDLEAGGSLVLYTDGVTDARGADGRFGPERLEAALREAASGDADDLADAVDGALGAFEVGAQRDDVALLVLSAAGPRTTQIAESSGAPA